MTKKLPRLLLILILYTGSASAQSITDTLEQVIQLRLITPARLYGSVADTVNYKPMAYSSVTLIRKDSFLFRHQFTNQQSQFNFINIKPDTYRLLITRPGFADYEEDLSLLEGEEKNVGTIALFSKSNLLREVLIKDRQAIRLKGDTIEFLVDSFLVNKNSNVEDLLKRLPGIQVDKAGKIKAQGQEVKKVLVDGEEFFGNDPTVATRNLKADNIETVQVFDKKSDQAAFTGIDDGVKEKTINLTMKEDAKKGYFGKIKAAEGTKPTGLENRYENEAMFNRFRNKRKFSVFGTLSNTNLTGLNWDDMEKYAGGYGNTEYDEASGYMYSYYESGQNDFNGVGVPQTRYLGTFYSNKLKQDKHNFNFTANNKQTIVTDAIDDNFTQYILPDTMYFNRQKNIINTQRNANSFSGKYDIKIDSLSTLTFKLALSQGSAENKNEFTSENYNGDSQLVNRNIRTNINSNSSFMGNYSLLYNKKFIKTGRTVSALWDQKISNNESEGFLKSHTYFNSLDTLITDEQLIDQKKISNEKTNNFGGRITYTEPLSKKWFVVADYDIHLTANNSKRITYNKPFGDYNRRVDSLSNELKYDININKGGLALKYATKKLNYSIGARISYTDLTQHNLVTDSTINKVYINKYPSARFSYKKSNYSSFSIDYNGSTRQPSLQQIQPIQDNSNPLLITKGNPDLAQSFRNTLNARYNNYKPLTGSSVYFNVSYNFTYNDFASYDRVDGKGRRVTQTVNVDGNQSWNFYSGYYFSIKKWHLEIGNSLNGGQYKSSNFINGLSNINKNTNLTYNLNLNFDVEEKIDVSFSPSVTYNRSSTSLRKDVVTEYFTYAYVGSMNLKLPKKFIFYIDGQLNIRQRTSTFDRNYNTFIVSSYISKKLFKNDKMEVRIGVEDLLNQNIGFERNATSNYINENTYTVLKRYVLFSLIYNFNNGPLK